MDTLELKAKNAQLMGVYHSKIKNCPHDCLVVVLLNGTKVSITEAMNTRNGSIEIKTIKR